MHIRVLNTGGTFNKKYNPIKGELQVEKNHNSLKEILNWCFNISFNIEDIISKDSLDIDDKDRDFLCEKISSSKEDKILIIHGTDTMNETAEYIAKRVNNKKVVITGAMIPMSINKVEATMNFSSAIGFFNADVQSGVYIALHGAVVSHDKIYKNRDEGKFLILD